MAKIYDPGALKRNLSRTKFGLLIYVAIVIIFGLVAAANGRHWSIQVWLLIGLWLLVSLATAFKRLKRD